jgi:hypothetical protein
MNAHLGDNRTEHVAFRQADYMSHHDLGYDSKGLAEQKSNSAVLTLFENGMILNCDNEGTELFGCESAWLKWQPISRFLPQLAKMPLMLDKKVNPYLRFLSITGHVFEAIDTKGVHFSCELYFTAVQELGKCCLQITINNVGQMQANTLGQLRAN